MRTPEVKQSGRGICLAPVRYVLICCALMGVFPSVAAELLNNPPVAQNDENYDLEDTPQIGDVSLNDSDPNGDPLTFTIVSPPSNGTLTMNPDGTYEYMPDPEYVGFDYATYQVCDPGGLCATAQIEFAMMFQNDLPFVFGESFTVFMNTPFTGSVATNDYDVDIEPLFYSVLSAPSNTAAFSLSLNGNFSITPANGYTGVISFIYMACDPCGACVAATATITVVNNSPPVAVDDFHFTTLNESLELSVAQNDSDPNGDQLTYSVLNGPDHGDFELDSDGSYLYTPDPYFAGFDYVTYKVCDPFGSCDQAVLEIEVVFVNVTPVAEDDYYSGQEDGVVTGTVATNDYDLNVEVLQFNLILGPSVGSFTWNPQTGSFTFTPPANWSGSAMAVYNTCDPCNACDVGVLYIEITPVNDTPVANPDSKSGNEDTVISGNVSSNDSDAEPGTLTYAVVTGPSVGSLNFNAAGQYSYTPPANYAGQVQFTYSVCDAQNACAQTTVTLSILSVNDVPVVSGESYELDEDGTLQDNVAANDYDVESISLTYSVIQATVHGALSLQPNGIFTYSPQENYHGADSFTYQACDANGACVQGVTSIIVNAVNDLPVATNDGFALFMNQSLSGSVATNDSDSDGETLSYVLLTPPSNGELIWNTDGAFTFTPDELWYGEVMFTYSVCDPSSACVEAEVDIVVSLLNSPPVAGDDSFSGNEDVQITGSLSGNDSDPEGYAMTYSLVSPPLVGVLTLNPNGSFVYQPPLNFVGSVEAEYAVCDIFNECALAQLSLVLGAVNDAPVAVNDALNVSEDLSGQLEVSANDSDVDDALLTYSILIDPLFGDAEINDEGLLLYTPQSDYTGSDALTYRVCDPLGACATALVNIIVLAVNDAPVASDDDGQMDEDTVLSGDLSQNDWDVDGDVLSYSLISGPLSGALDLSSDGSFQYTPDEDFFGAVSFSYEVCDDGMLCDQALVTIDVHAVNDNPVALSSSVSVNEDIIFNSSLLSFASDVDDVSLVFSIIGTPENGVISLTPDGQLTYTPDSNYSGGDELVWQVCDDGGLCNSGVLTISVIEVNDSPVAVDDLFVFNEDQIFGGNVSLNDTDVETSPLSFSLVSWPESGGLQWNSDGSFVFTPQLNYYGTLSFQYKVCDVGLLCDEGTVQLQINPVNDLPVVQGETLSVNEDETGVIDLSANDFDVDGDALVYSIQVTPVHGSALIQPDGSLSYYPDSDFWGEDELVYRVCDGQGGCVLSALSIVVQAVNDAPVTNDDHVSLDMDESASGSVAVNDNDPDGDDLHFSVVQTALYGELDFEDNGAFVYTPLPGWSGEDVVTYQVCDQSGSCTEGKLFIQVEYVNSPPVAADLSDVICANASWQYNLSELVSDEEDSDEDLQITMISSSGGMWAMNEESHNLSFEPDGEFSGNATFVYSVCDGAAECSEGEISIEIMAVSQPQVISAVVNGVSCHGQDDGIINIEVDGGNVQYEWSNGSFDQDITELEPGLYSVILTRAGFCSEPSEFSYEITEPDPITVTGLNADPIDETPGGSSDYTVNGGTPPFAYQWFIAGGGELVSESKVLAGLEGEAASGGYELVITDANGCTFSSTLLITSVAELDEAGMLLAPNPVSHELVIVLNGPGLSGHGEFSVYDMTGRCVIRQEGLTSESFTHRIPVTELGQGMYILRAEFGAQIISRRFEKM